MRDHTELRAFEFADEVVLLKLTAFSLQSKQPEQLLIFSAQIFANNAQTKK